MKHDPMDVPLTREMSREIMASAHLTIFRVQAVCALRAQRWHNGDMNNWTPLEWAGAMCGEAGEAANIAKKMRRFDLDMVGNSFSDHPATDMRELVELMAHECADTFLYLVLLAQRCGIDLGQAVRDRFNGKSVEMGYPERL